MPQNLKQAIEQATDYIAKTSQELVKDAAWPALGTSSERNEMAAETMRAAIELASAVIKYKTEVLPNIERETKPAPTNDVQHKQESGRGR